VSPPSTEKAALLKEQNWRRATGSWTLVAQVGGNLQGLRFLPDLISSFDQISIFIFQSQPDFRFQIAIMIAIENLITINHDPVFHERVRTRNGSDTPTK
jgi:hypothetical protein